MRRLADTQAADHLNRLPEAIHLNPYQSFYHHLAYLYLFRNLSFLHINFQAHRYKSRLEFIKTVIRREEKAEKNQQKSNGGENG